MASIYVDTSALGRVLLAEPDAKVVDAALSSYEARWSSSLLAVELGRLGKAESLEAEAAEQLKTVVLLPVTEARLVLAAAIDPPEVRSLDAIHLASAVELHSTGRVTAVMTYDRQLTAGCAHHGVPVVAPAV